MSFPKEVKEIALVKSRRCCCVCHEFAGVYTNVHHIVPEADEGPNTLENAIVLCLRCHGEAGRYNARHPIGNKYSSEELRGHRDAWWKWCEEHPAAPLPKQPIEVTPNVPSPSIGIDIIHSQREFFVSDGVLTARGDILRIDGKDGQGDSAAIIVFTSLEPKEIRTLVVKNKLPQKSVSLYKPKVNVNIIKFER
jgi:hypothetical protein